MKLPESVLNVLRLSFSGIVVFGATYSVEMKDSHAKENGLVSSSTCIELQAEPQPTPPPDFDCIACGRG